MTETIVIDPSAIDSTRTQLDITAWVKAEGIDWGDAAIEAYMAEQAVGSAPADFRIPNRTVAIPLTLRDQGSTAYATILSNLQRKIGLLQREGGSILRQIDSTTLYADIVDAKLHLGGSWMAAYRSVDVDAHIELTCLPDFYGAEATLDTITGTGEILSLLKTSTATAVIGGDHSGRLRSVFTDTSGNDQRGLIMGLRSRYYSNSTYAALAYNASQLTPASGASATALTGSRAAAKSGSPIKFPSLPPSFWVPVMKTDYGGTTPLIHRGTYRVIVRAYATAGNAWWLPPSLRLSWGIGDSQYVTLNDVKQLSSTSSFYIVDLGEISLRAAPVGTHWWRGVISARSATSAQDIYIDRIWFVPVDEAYCQLSAPPVVVAGQSPVVAWDTFDTLGNGATLDGREAPLGGTWNTYAIGGGGSATDFNGNPNGQIQRGTTADGYAGQTYGRLAIAVDAGPFTDTEVGGQFYTNGFPTGNGELQPAVIARYVDTNNMLKFGFWRYGFPFMVLYMVVGGTSYPLGTLQVLELPNQWLDIKLKVSVNGTAIGTVALAGGQPLYTVTGWSAQLATGGTLATGRVGLQDYNGSAIAYTRYYDNFYAIDPTAEAKKDAVMFGSGSVYVQYNGHWRGSASGGAGVPVPRQVGDLPRVPPSGMEARPVEMVAIVTRGDLESVPDSAAADGVSLVPYYRPAYLTRP
jgi:hypothetical protein